MELNEGNSEAGEENPKINTEEVAGTPLINKEKVPILHLQLIQALKITWVLSHSMELQATEEALKEEEENFPSSKGVTCG
jgi:hypothetical protein